MKTMSESPVDAAGVPPDRRVLIWDAPVRVFHWLMVACFAGAYLTAEGERWRLVHVTLGLTMVGLLVFRVAWGLVGTRHARFASFVRGPRVVGRALRDLLAGRPRPVPGHNPVGAVAIVALLVLTAVVTATGWATETGLGADAGEEAHELAANLMLALVGLHVAGVVIASRLHRESLVRAMLTGRKAARPDEAIGGARRAVAWLMVAAVLGFWGFQWASAPTTGAVTPGAPAAGHAEHSDRDDD